MNNVNKTLYIPLYGKALVSKKGIILHDETAESIWEKEQFPLKGKSKSKWLAYFMSMRSSVFDKWTKEKITEYPSAIVLHLGCGLDSRIHRVNAQSTLWYDVDFPAVIQERKLYFAENEHYRMIEADVQDETFVNALTPSERAIVIIEGVSMYLENQKLQQLLSTLCTHFSHLSVLIDCYTPFAVKMSKLKNPVKEVGVNTVYGIANSEVLTQNTQLRFVQEHSLTPQSHIDELKGMEKFIFKTLYAGQTSKKLYKMYEYES